MKNLSSKGSDLFGNQQSGQAWTPDPAKSLADNGLKHKDVIRFRTPGLEGIKGSCA